MGGVFPPATALAVDEAQKRELESLARAGSTPPKLARQCAVILLASQGIPNHAIAQRTGLSRPTVIATRQGFLTGGLEALCQRQKRNRRRSVLTTELEQKILERKSHRKLSGASPWAGIREVPEPTGEGSATRSGGALHPG
jgi:DNA-binding CsgD family transcriptional regulator